MAAKHFAKIKKIDSGGMADIYLGVMGRGTEFRRPCVIKEIRQDLAAEAGLRQAFKEEVKAYERLQHSNIVQVLDFYAEGNNLALIMEYIPGDNLQKILNSCIKMKISLSVPMCVFIAKEVARGLAYAHNSNNPLTGEKTCIVHRDLSPSNIIVSLDGEVKILDFGIAKASDSENHTSPGVLKGKLGYFAPEQLLGKPASVLSDLYSLGVVLWESLALQRLYKVENILELERRVKNPGTRPRLTKLNDEVNQELESLVDKLLSYEPSERFQSAEELDKELSSYLSVFYPKFNTTKLSIFVKSIIEKKINESAQELRTALAKEDLFESSVTTTESVEHNNSSSDLPQDPKKSAVKKNSNVELVYEESGEENLQFELDEQSQRNASKARNSADKLAYVSHRPSSVTQSPKPFPTNHSRRITPTQHPTRIASQRPKSLFEQVMKFALIVAILVFLVAFIMGPGLKLAAKFLN